MAEKLTIRMPALSATMEEGELVRWSVEVGDTVASGQPIAEVVTDKVDMALESPYDGVVAELVAEVGTAVRVGQPVATLTSESADLLGGLGLDDDAPDTPAAEAVPPPRDAAAEAATSTGDTAAADGPAAGGAAAAEGIVPAPPPTRKRARELGVDLADVPRTGARGQVTPEDLDGYLAARNGDPTPVADRPPAVAEPSGDSPAAEGSPGEAAAADIPGSRPVADAAAPAPARTAAPEPGGEDAPVVAPAQPRAAPAGGRREAVRAATAKLMIASAAVPQFVLHRRVDLSRAQERKQGRSWNTEIARALCVALRASPEFTARWDDDGQRVVALDEPRLGLAVESDDGLLVVGLDPLDQLSPDEADHHVRDTVRRARAGRLSAADRSGLTATLSSLGSFGVDHFVALVMPPQALILSVGRVAEVPAVVDGRVRPLLGVDLGLSVDHRVADGAQGARLLARVADELEG